MAPQAPRLPAATRERQRGLRGLRGTISRIAQEFRPRNTTDAAMSHGLPVVATPVAAEGMYAVDGETILLGDDADSFAAAVLRLHDDEPLWNRLSVAGLLNVQQHFSSEAARKTLRALP